MRFLKPERTSKTRAMKAMTAMKTMKAMKAMKAERTSKASEVEGCCLWDRDRAMRADRLIWACNAEKWACGEAEFDQAALDPYQRPIVLIDMNEEGGELLPTVSDVRPPSSDDEPPLKRMR